MQFPPKKKETIADILWVIWTQRNKKNLGSYGYSNPYL